MKPASLALGAAAILLAGCAAVGPNYAAPPATPTAAAPFVGQGLGAFTSHEPPGDWWRLYQDPTLDALVQQALANNREIAVAAANLAQVRALLTETRTGRLPSTAISATATASRQPNPVSGESVDAETVSVGLDVAYELDLFGRLGRSIEAVQADVDAARAAVDVLRVSVAGETARAYADACGAGVQLQVAERTLALQEQTAGLTRTQLEAGSGAGLDVARAQAQVESTCATVPPLLAQRDAALFRLAVLTGRAPAELPAQLGACASVPAITSPIPVGDGAALLSRRPDIRRAERALAAATARIGVATAGLYPAVSLGGSVATFGGGGQSFGSDLQFSAGPLISWSFPNRAAARARIAQADAATQAAAASFEQTTLVALQEVETALSGYARELDRREALRRARDQSQRAVEIARLRQQSGVDSIFTVLDAERTLAALEAQLAQSEVLVANQQITLFKALGGGWQAAAAATS